jgi:hypothetical protein
LKYAQKIDMPRLPAGHLARRIECRDAIAGAFTVFLEDAKARGWTVTEIADAVMDLADDILLREADDEDASDLLRAILVRKNM